MNILFWVFQVLMSLHTLIGAVWKFSNSAEDTMPSLKAIPNLAWMAMGAFEILLSLCLLIPFVYKPLAILAPAAAACIAAEMVLFIGLHFYSGDSTLGPVIYWVVVASICVLIAYGRLVLVPFNQETPYGSKSV